MQVLSFRLNTVLCTLFECIDVGAVFFYGGTVEGKRTKPVGIGHIGLFCELCGQFVEGKTNIPAL